MQLQNNYYFFKSVISPENCKKIIDLGLSKINDAKSKGLNTEATTFGKNHRNNRPDSLSQSVKTVEDLVKETKKPIDEIEKEIYIRDSEVSWINDQWVYDLILPFVHTANNESGWKYNIDFCEDCQFTVYKPGGFYGWHADGNSCHLGKYKRYIPGISPTDENGKPKSGYVDNNNYVGKIRKLSLTLNLNVPGEYEGGNLKFDFGPHVHGERYHECEQIRPQGSIIVFPSYLHHQVTPIEKGTRYSLVLWVLGEPFK